MIRHDANFVNNKLALPKPRGTKVPRRVRRVKRVLTRRAEKRRGVLYEWRMYILAGKG